MIRIGARRSPLAVVQAESIADALRAAGHECELVGVVSQGDVDRRHLTEIGGTGVFATAVRDQLTAGQIDVAVHSLKDLPVAPAPGLAVAAIPQREDVRDVVVGLGVDDWADGMTVGTGSPRRAVQLAALARQRGVEVRVVPVRGNVDSRLGLVADGKVHATVLAAAGLLRLGRLDAAKLETGVDARQRVTLAGLSAELMAVGDLMPAAGQGALAVECREDDAELRAALADIDHAATRAAVVAERSFLSRLEAGCLAPVGAWAQVSDDAADLTLHVVAGEESAQGSKLLRQSVQGSSAQAAQVGERLAEQVLQQLDVKAEETQ